MKAYRSAEERPSVSPAPCGDVEWELYQVIRMPLGVRVTAQGGYRARELGERKVKLSRGWLDVEMAKDGAEPFLLPEDEFAAAIAYLINALGGDERLSGKTAVELVSMLTAERDELRERFEQLKSSVVTVAHSDASDTGAEHVL